MSTAGVAHVVQKSISVTKATLLLPRYFSSGQPAATGEGSAVTQYSRFTVRKTRSCVRFKLWLALCWILNKYQQQLNITVDCNGKSCVLACATKVIHVLKSLKNAATMAKLELSTLIIKVNNPKRLKSKMIIIHSISGTRRDMGRTTRTGENETQGPMMHIDVVFLEHQTDTFEFQF